MIHKAIKISTGLDWNKDRFEKDINSYKDGTELWIDVLVKPPTKTELQIRYIYVLLGYIAEETGYTKEQAKDKIKKKREYWEEYKDKKTGKPEKRIKSFRELLKEEANNWIDYLLDLCEALEIRVPCPNCGKPVSVSEIIKDKETKKLYCKFCKPKGVTQ